MKPKPNKYRCECCFTIPCEIRSVVDLNFGNGVMNDITSKIGCSLCKLGNKSSDKLKSNQILLTFESAEQADTIRTICRRRGLDPKTYIIDNLIEWDGPLPCMDGDPITADTCDGCDYADRCPDVEVK